MTQSNQISHRVRVKKYGRTFWGDCRQQSDSYRKECTNLVFHDVSSVESVPAFLHISQGLLKEMFSEELIPCLMNLKRKEK